MRCFYTCFDKEMISSRNDRGFVKKSAVVYDAFVSTFLELLHFLKLSAWIQPETVTDKVLEKCKETNNSPKAITK